MMSVVPILYTSLTTLRQVDLIKIIVGRLTERRLARLGMPDMTQVARQGQVKKAPVTKCVILPLHPLPSYCHCSTNMHGRLCLHPTAMSPMLWQLTWGAGVLDPSNVSRGAVQQGTQLVGGLHAGGAPSGIHPCVCRLHPNGRYGLNFDLYNWLQSCCCAGEAIMDMYRLG